MGIKSEFTKYDLYQILRTKDDLAYFLPPTVIFENFEDALEFIEYYKKVVLRPIYGSAGGGVCIVERCEENYKITDCRRKRHISLKLHSVDELKSFFKNTFDSIDKYMLQKLIKSVKIEQSVFDFRVVMKKSSRGSWKCFELEYTAGGNNFLVINKYRDDRLAVLNEAVQKNYPLKFDFKEAIDQVKKLCTRICSNIDSTLEYEEGVEFEIAIDEAHKPWFIEIDLLKCIKKFEAVDYTTYFSEKSVPLLYSIPQYSFINM